MNWTDWAHAVDPVPVNIKHPLDLRYSVLNTSSPNKFKFNYPIGNHILKLNLVGEDQWKTRSSQ